jgi:hypothetical protein
VSDATCKTCPFFASYLGAAEDARLGTCRRSPPVPLMTASGGDHPELGSENPEVSSAWWCGEHPLRQRDRLAAMAMQGWLASWPAKTWLAGEPTQLAEHAYRVADAMLAARASPSGEGAKS